MMNFNELKDLLDAKVEQYNTPDFILNDPIQIPHRFSSVQDIEISAFLTATITWGNRKSIIKSADKMMQLLGDAPFDFVQNHTAKDLDFIEKQTVHRTFKGEDLVFFIHRLRLLYQEQPLFRAFLFTLGTRNQYERSTASVQTKIFGRKSS